MTEWPRVRLGDLAAAERSAISKPYGSAIIRDDYRDAGVPVVRGVNLARGRFYDDGFVFISEDLADLMPGARLRPGDLVFTHRGSVGQVSMIPRGARYDRYTLSTSQVKARLDLSVAIPEFFYYWFRSPAGQHSILQGTSTVGVPGLARPVETIKSLSVPLPSLDEQQRVANLLGALDDLINTNRGLIDMLVRQADSIALGSRRPGSPMTFGEVCGVLGGGTPKTSVPEYWNGKICWATPTDITALKSPYLFTTSRRITQSGLDACSSDLHPPGSILMTSRATIGAFALAQAPTATNQGFIVVEPRRPADRYFLFHEMRRRVPEFMDRANGSTFMEISRGTFKSLAVDWPSEEVRDELSRNVDPLHRAAVDVERESIQLESCRDELLPLLLSGRVRVKAAKESLVG